MLYELAASLSVYTVFDSLRRPEGCDEDVYPSVDAWCSNLELYASIYVKFNSGRNTHAHIYTEGCICLLSAHPI